MGEFIKEIKRRNVFKVALVYMAEIYADAGDLDKTFEWLGHTARVRDPGGPWAMVMQFFEEAWEDPRWEDYLAEFNL
ncbi:MAG: hypothetical protein QNJ11_14810 [Woeseiaceae bacterium]|nr:hypothetical protein [Woeseiaceae bacterium]